MRLDRVFRAAVLSVSATQCDEDAAVPPFDASLPADASEEASEDVHDAGYQFITDTGFTWCEAGPPTFVDACGSCCAIEAVHCPIPPGDYVGDSSGLYFCDRYCGGTFWQGCSVIDASDAETYVTCGCTGRRFEGYEDVASNASLGARFANMARLEAASVFAFDRLHDELADLGASPRLLARVRRASKDERRHTRMMTHLARRSGGRVVPVRAPRFRRRDAEAIAIENATEGCVRELFGALVATYHATHARDRELQRTFAVLARDETRHAELALRVAAFLSRRLDATSRARVAVARRETIASLRREIADDARSLALFDEVFRTMRA